MMTGRVASRATSNDFMTLAEREMIINETRPGSSSQSHELDQAECPPKGESTILLG